MRKTLLAVCFLAFATACGSQDDAAATGDGASVGGAMDVMQRLENLPATVEGELSAPLAEDEGEGEGGGTEFDYAGLVVDGVGLSVRVDDGVLSAAGIPADYEQVRVRATIGSKDEHGSLLVTRLEKL